jgi:hypothetical protein
MTFSIKTTPKAPKANGTMTVKVKVWGADRPHGVLSLAAPTGRGELSGMGRGAGFPRGCSKGYTQRGSCQGSPPFQQTASEALPRPQ